MTELGDAWQRALAAEQQAVFGYALLGPHLDPGVAGELAHTCQSAHEALRDKAIVAVTATGGAPTSPAPDYPSLYPVPDARSAQSLAIRLEQDAASAWRYLYAVAADATGAPPAAARTAAQSARTAAQAALTASAVRATRWRLLVNPAAATVAFPGI